MAHSTVFRDRVSREPGARFKPEAGRYHLYVMYGCPWAHRTIIVRRLKGLESAIGMTAVHHRLVEGQGWTFAPERPEPLYGLTRLREIYEMASPGYTGKITVPVLWDKNERTIVNNESAEIVRMFGSEFNEVAENPQLDLYPIDRREQIDFWNERIQDAVNEGVYTAGFTNDQAVYEQAATRFFERLQEIERHLGQQRFLAGNTPTEADWRLFPTLIRLEWVYQGLFKLDRRRLSDHPNLFGYARELYQWPGIAETVNIRHIRHGYWPSLTRLNPSGIVPLGPDVDFLAPHGRTLRSAPPAAFT
jgi:glutathionyl-hydroquinone reductase